MGLICIESSVAIFSTVKEKNFNNKTEYISNAATHLWINEDAISQLEILINQTDSIIVLLKNELKSK